MIVKPAIGNYWSYKKILAFQSNSTENYRKINTYFSNQQRRWENIHKANWEGRNYG